MIKANLILFLISGFIFGASLTAQQKKEYFHSPSDSAFDISGYLNSPQGFFPVPFIITEPAVGYGGGMGALFFHDKKNFIEKYGPGKLPPKMSVVAGGYTSNGTWFAALGHQGSYAKDKIRYTGAVSWLSPNLNFYGAGIMQDEREYLFNMEGFLTFQELSFRIKNKVPLFMGFNYLYFNNSVAFQTESSIPQLEELSTNINLGGLNYLLMYDTRNSVFTPSKGFFAAFELGGNAEFLGSDGKFGNYANRIYYYLPLLNEKLVGGFRFFAQSRWGEVPFYALPYIPMRGIQMLRYQDNNVVVGETEWRWNVYNRWSLIGFTGAGLTAPSVDQFNFSEAKISGGGGFRYFIAKDYGIHAGVDVARGPEIWAWYIVVGSYWFR